jgi:hypothetical protein
MGSWAFKWLGGAGLLLACLAACGTEAPGTGLPPGSRELGERCDKTEDCASLLCVRLDERGGVCSNVCEADDGCPQSDNWACLPTQGRLSVCGCLPLADTEVCGDGLDNECNAKVDDCRICDGRPVPNDDPQHCGECGNRCRVDQLCTDQACRCLPAHPDECGGACVDPQVDLGHCGECGTACGIDQICSAGSCVCPDPNQPDYCPALGCLSLASDQDHCGACGSICDQGRSCVGGDCVCPPGAAANFCDGLGCVDFESDEGHCGACENACRGDQLCLGGECVCPAGAEDCEGACVDLTSDRENCGECGTSCPSAQTCIGGDCGCSAVGYAVCGDDCVHLPTDQQNCGVCGEGCASGETCNGGDCGCASAVYCGTSCMPVDDEQNCGACGTACSVSQYCSAGECECQGFGLSPCGSDCFDLSSDELNCGECGEPCRSGESCNFGGCACPSGQTYCAEAGTCVPLLTDEAHCGTCGHDCNPTEVCSGGYCGCPLYGQQYCASQTACTDTLSNEAHCGNCDDPCNPTEVCSGGVCDCPGATEQFCASANSCVNTQTDSEHCGGCDKACPAGTHCSSGGCVCDAVGQTLCDQNCYDLTTNADHCSDCDNDCGGSRVCIRSTCFCPSATVSAPVPLTNRTRAAERPAVAFGGTHIGLAYLEQIGDRNSHANVRFALLNLDGTVLTDVALTAYPEDTYEGSPTSHDRPSITWNGSEYAVGWVYDVPEADGYASAVYFARVSAAGVPSAPVVVATTTELPNGASGGGVAWSVPGTTYGVAYSDVSGQKVYLRLIGSQGTALQPPVSIQATAYIPALATDPTGRWGMNWFAGTTLGQAVFNAAGQSPEVVFRDIDGGWSNIFWDGTSFTTVYDEWPVNELLWQRFGATASLRLLRDPDNNSGPPLSALVSGSLGVVWPPQTGVLKFQRFALPATLNTATAPLDDGVTIPTPSSAIAPMALVGAGNAKLMAVYGMAGLGTGTDIYGSIITVPACP